MPLRVALLLPCFLLSFAGCGPPVPSVTSPTPPVVGGDVRPATTARAVAVAPSPGRATGDASGFLGELRGRGVTVERVAEAQEPFFRPIGMRLRLGGGPLPRPAELAVYPYDCPATAAEDAGRVQPDTTARWTTPDGNVRTVSYAWVAPPHFFRRGTILVLYTGTDPAVLGLLTDLLGPQFAGRS